MINDNSKINMRIKRLHFIGIGGSGMGGIAEVLHHLNYEVSGSDITENQTTKRLQNLGIKVYIGHHANNVGDCQAVVTSSAIGKNNIEVKTAKESRIAIVPRAEMLAELMRFRYGIAISGSHGKTTTTSLIAHILAHAKKDPTFIIGGILKTTQSNAQLGTGDYLVVEADESDASFLKLKPMLSVITNIDNDHLQTYGNDFAKLERAFLNFISNLPFYGLCVVCADDPGVYGILSRISRNFICYGTAKNSDVCAENIEHTQTQTHFDVTSHYHQKRFTIRSHLIGHHNVLNSLAAITVALELGVDTLHIQQALANFSGVGRRLECYGKLCIGNKNIILFDDYGHHPAELQAVINSLQQSYPKQRLFVIFQAHRYSRTAALFTEFTQVLAQISALILVDIYAANEKPIKGINASALADSIYKKNKTMPMVMPLKKVCQVLPDIAEDNDIVLTIGAGDIASLAKEIYQTWS